MAGFEQIFKGRPVEVEILTGIPTSNWRRPPPAKAWVILGGMILHVTGTNTNIDVVKLQTDLSAIVLWHIKTIASAQATSDQYPLFEVGLDTTTPLRVGDFQSAWTPYIILSNMGICLLGDATAKLRIQVLEFDYI